MPNLDIKLPLLMSKVIVKCLLLKETMIPIVLDLRISPPKFVLRLLKDEQSCTSVWCNLPTTKVIFQIMGVSISI